MIELYEQIDMEMDLLTALETEIKKRLNSRIWTARFINEHKQQVALLGAIIERRRDLKTAKKVIKDMEVGRKQLINKDELQGALDRVFSNQKGDYGGEDVL